MIVKSADWSASSDRFKLAEAVLLDDFDTANYLVKKIGSQGDVKIFAYREWPIFREYRKTEGVLKPSRRFLTNLFIVKKIYSLLLTG